MMFVSRATNRSSFWLVSDDDVSFSCSINVRTCTSKISLAYRHLFASISNPTEAHEPEVLSRFSLSDGVPD